MDFSTLTSSLLESKSLDHLGLISGMCNELGIEKQIDMLIPNPGCGKKISYGKLVVAMIINGLGFTSKSLYLVQDFFKDKAIDRLLGAKISADDINDDNLGRTLDALFRSNVSSVFSSIACNAYKYLGLKSSSLHLDSTSFHTDGNHYSSNNEDVIKITRGYSKDHRPELNQCILNLIIESQSSIPLFMEAANGNRSDKKGFAEIVKNHVSRLQNNFEVNYFISDSSLYTPESLAALNESCHFITRVPEVTLEAKAAIKKAADADKINIDSNYSFVEYNSNYGDCAQRWFVIHSKEAAEKERKSLGRKLEKITNEEQKLYKSLTRIKFDCYNDATIRLKEFMTSVKLIDTSNCAVEKVKHKKKISYRITGETSFPITSKAELEKYCGLFILATNQLDPTRCDAADVLSEYKGQHKVERGFRFMKAPYFFTSSFYLKKPERITALLMIMTLCLLVYSALEYKLRLGLKLYGLYVLSQTKRKTQAPTAKWVFESFAGIHIIYKRNTGSDIQSLILNLQDRQKVILQALGDIYAQIYS